jgi:hypothetical protein
MREMDTRVMKPLAAGKLAMLEPSRFACFVIET